MNSVFKLTITSISLSFVLAFQMLVSSCVFTQGPSYGVTLQEDTSEYLIEYDWNYGGQRWRYTAYIPVTVYEHFVEQDRPGDYREYIFDELDDDWLGYTAQIFEQTASEEEWEESETINFVMKFTQYLPYQTDEKTTTAGLTEYPRYPIETMIDCGISKVENGAKGADCEDTVVLLVSILREMGYEVALLLYPEDEHMAAGVRVTSDFIVNWSAYDLTYYEKESKLWVYCETTKPFWALGQKHDQIESLPQIVEIV